ncbi:MAG: DUF1385 domain-containing protein [Chloroflexota bacterium]|nr:MAG: DUF1385 domain-containing protein [Chloroflexota bacterium]
MKSKFHYGGQAVIEGVMIRGRKSAVTAVRRPNREITTHSRPLSPVYTGRMRKAPLLRGIIVLIEAMVLGISSLLYSANVSLEEEEEEITGKAVWLMITVAVLLAVILFLVIPLFLTRLINPYINSSLVFHLIEGAIRLLIFIAYLKLVGLLPDIKRIFTYHGAEHKAVNAYEHGVPLEVEAVKIHDKAHVRCGTSFLFVVLVIAIVVFALVGRPSLWLMILSRILLIPVIAALGYEFIQFGANHAGNPLVRAMIIPGLWLQGMTAEEPEDDQIDVALVALKTALEIDQSEETPQLSS